MQFYRIKLLKLVHTYIPLIYTYIYIYVFFFKIVGSQCMPPSLIVVGIGLVCPFPSISLKLYAMHCQELSPFSKTISHVLPRVL